MPVPVPGLWPQAACGVWTRAWSQSPGAVVTWLAQLAVCHLCFTPSRHLQSEVMTSYVLGSLSPLGVGCGRGRRTGLGGRQAGFRLCVFLLAAACGHPLASLGLGPTSASWVAWGQQSPRGMRL